MIRLPVTATEHACTAAFGITSVGFDLLADLIVHTASGSLSSSEAFKEARHTKIELFRHGDHLARYHDLYTSYVYICTHCHSCADHISFPFGTFSYAALISFSSPTFFNHFSRLGYFSIPNPAKPCWYTHG